MRVALVAAALGVSSTTLTFCASSEVQTFERNANGATLYSESGALRVSVCSDRIVHVVASPVREIPVAIVPAVIGECNDSQFIIESNKSKISVRTAALEVSIDRATGVVRFLSADGKTILSEPASGGRKLTPETIQGVSTFQVQQVFLSPADEALYGLGQHQEGIFNLRELPLRLQQANTNISVPVLLSTKGYGLLWNNASLTDFNVADEPITLNAATGEGTFRTGAAGEYGFLLTGNRRSRLRLSVDTKAVIDINNMWVADSASAKISLKADSEYKISAQTGGDTKLFARPPSATTVFRSEAGGAVDYYFFYGPELNRVISEYRQMTGAAPLLPRWAYGFWQCRERYSSQQQILDTAAEFRTRKIPVDVIVQDWQYWGKYGWNAMRFDEQYYPEPAQLMTELHKENLHLVASVWAKFGTETTVDQDMKKGHLLLASTDNTREPGEAQAKEDWADLFNPKAQELFWSELNRGLFRDGMDGWWLDASEPEGDPLKGVPTFLGPGELVRNAYPLYETTAVYKGQRAANDQKRVVILTRSAFSGQQRNGTISWSGDVSADWDTLRRQIPAGLSFSMSGLPYWTTDIGGFFRPNDQYTSDDYHELLIRWFEFGTFSPIFRVHGYRSETEMWKYGPDVEQELRKFDTLRYRLLPYIYSQAWDVTEKGGTIMRALPLEYPDDASVREIQDQFLFGPSLLVSPVVDKGARERGLWLPAADNWVDFWTGQRHQGGERIKAEAPISQIPIHVKEGSIVVLGPAVQSTADSEDPLEIRIYPGRDADFTFYQDQGDGYSYESGQRATISMHWDDRHQILIVGTTNGSFPNMPKQHTLRIVKVHSGHGVGVAPELNADRVVEYEGQRIAVELRDSNRASTSATPTQ
ncbi:MAG TPA: TIM-barrel domain-containing protein [Terracidiphilus sp.]|nr:TIM-barrel domain-containing protein [Terracidiphilus sp.]